MENIKTVALENEHLFLCNLFFSIIFLCASMTLKQLSPFPSAVEEVSYFLASFHLCHLRLLDAALTSSPISLMFPSSTGRFSLGGPFALWEVPLP